MKYSIYIASVVFSGLICSIANSANRPQEVQWNTVASATLLATGEPAKVHNPECSTGIPTAASVVRGMIYNAMDAYVGYPVFSTINSISPEAKNWMNERIGANDGRSSCALLCGIVEAETSVKICEADAMYGRACFMAGDTGDGPQPYSNTGPMTRAVSGTGQSEVVCTTIKNWSDNLQRTFTMESEP